jgi:selenocysteine-specific elongation factor
LIVSLPFWDETKKIIRDLVDSYHKQFPLRRGIPREELKSRLKLSPKIFNPLLETLISHEFITEERGAVSTPGWRIRFNEQDQIKVETLRRKFESNPFSPPSVNECKAEVGSEAVNALVELGELVLVSSEIVFRKTDYERMASQVIQLIETQGQTTLAEVRNILNTTRKYAQALLEHLDAVGTTIRNGDVRILRK